MATSPNLRVVFLNSDNIEEVSRKTGRSIEDLEQKLRDAMAVNKVWKFTIWDYDKKVGEE